VPAPEDPLDDPPLDDPPLEELLLEPPSEPVQFDSQLLRTHKPSGSTQPVVFVQLVPSQVVSCDEHIELTQLLQPADSVIPVVCAKAARGSLHPASVLDPPLLLEPPPSSLPLAASPSFSKPLPPLLFEEQAIAAPNEPAITAVHATDLSITAS
jgi:hypothetical protein